MMCDVCQVQEAKLHITQIVENEKSSLHICHDCAIKNGIVGHSGQKPFLIKNFQAGMPQPYSVPSPEDPESTPEKAQVQKTCPSCGLSYGAFLETGRLGCATCYFTFSDRLKPLFIKVQKKIEHHGKAPKKTDPVVVLKRDVTSLRMQLNEAIAQENFETAATLRDQIREMENKIKP